MTKRSQIPRLNTSVRDLGATPENAKPASSILTRSIESPIGELILGATDRGLCLLEFADRRTLSMEIITLQKLFRCAVISGNNRHLDHTVAELGLYFKGQLTSFSTPLEAPGTPFQTAVWNQLLRIPYGKTISYAMLAERVGRPGAQRAVGRANGDNRIAIIIPCHRVVQADGAMRGYGGGVWRKQYLLDLERQHARERGSGV